MLSLIPNPQSFWESLGGHFDSFSQIICEFVDNSISNFKSKSLSARIVVIRIENEGDKVFVEISDSGSGISDIQKALTIGDKSIRESPLNEHGFGIKHALAAADKSNSEWEILTKKSDSDSFTIISAPYSFEIEPQIKSQNWPGDFSSGTIVRFKCSKELFFTLRRGRRGNSGFPLCLTLLSEDLGYTYQGIISEGLVNITIVSKELASPIIVGSLRPNWQGHYDPGEGIEKMDLGGGSLTVKYKFGEIGESDYNKYYKKNISSSGVEILINGRVLVSNLFKDVWGLEPHNMYNHFLVQIDLVSDNRIALPKTRTSKNGIINGDPKFEKLLDWIKETHPTPFKDPAGATYETELVEMLAQFKKTHIPSPAKSVIQHFGVYKLLDSVHPVADLYVFDGSDVYLYEAKRNKSYPDDLYQLMMYWDGAVYDDIEPTEGILVAEEHSKGVIQLVKELNTRVDSNGKNYNFVLKRWEDEGIKSDTGSSKGRKRRIK